MLVRRDCTTKGQENFLAQLLACSDIRADVGTVIEEVAVCAVRVGVVGVTTLISKVYSRVATRLIWEHVHESNGDDVDFGIHTEVGESLLVWPLTLYSNGIQ